MSQNKWPPRVWISEEELKDLYGGGKPVEGSERPQCTDDIEYLSMDEHQALLRQALGGEGEK